ncbi:MAG: DUF6404 family protein [Pseudomonadota bacterium]
MTETTYEIRRRHALEELRARKVIGPNKPWIIHLTAALFPGKPLPYYGGHWRHGIVLGFFFALPFTLMIGGAFALDENLPAWPGIALGILSGVAFGVTMALYVRRVERRLKLTPWEQLDAGPQEAPDDAADIEDVNAAWSAGAGTVALGATVARRSVSKPKS